LTQGRFCGILFVGGNLKDPNSMADTIFLLFVISMAAALAVVKLVGVFI